MSARRKLCDFRQLCSVWVQSVKCIRVKCEWTFSNYLQISFCRISVYVPLLHWEGIYFSQFSPFQSILVQSISVQSSSFHSNAFQSSPVHFSRPVQPIPVQSSPIQCSPVQSISVQASPVPFSPVQSISVQSSSVHFFSTNFSESPVNHLLRSRTDMPRFEPLHLSFESLHFHLRSMQYPYYFPIIWPFLLDGIVVLHNNVSAS